MKHSFSCGKKSLEFETKRIAALRVAKQRQCAENKKRNSKRCTMCKIEKVVSSFGYRKDSGDGLAYCCRICDYKRKQKGLSPEEFKSKKKEGYLRRKEKHIKKVLEYTRSRKLRDPAYKMLITLRSRHTLAVKSAGRNKTFSTTVLLGCTAPFLKEYIEQQFSQEMTWENHGKVWHVDHIYPLCKVNWDNREQVSKACHYSNLQPLLIKDNLEKGGKIVEYS